VSGSWLQLVFALAFMYLLVMAAGYWGKRKRAQQEQQGHDRQDH